ncbi:chaperonin-like protein [Tanacetum coccineum]
MQSNKIITPFVFSLLLIVSLFFILSSGEPYTTPTSGGSEGVKDGVLVGWGAKRKLLDEEENEVNSTSLVLAQKRTTRKDPFNDFKKYRGGWNISERHYWAVRFFLLMICFINDRS